MWSSGGTSVPPCEIGVPRFELGTSPTRTERATRLRHTPSGQRLADELLDRRCAGIGPLPDQEVTAVRDHAQRRAEAAGVVERVLQRQLVVARAPQDDTGAP